MPRPEPEPAPQPAPPPGSRPVTALVPLLLAAEHGSAPEEVDAARRALDAALAGHGPAVLPLPTAHPAVLAALTAAARGAGTATGSGLGDVEAGVALVVPTSGSTGAPKLVELTAAALLASARAGVERLGGPGRWVLALPLTHVAGWQVLVRGAAAGTAPAPTPPGPFTAAGFTAAAREAAGSGRGYAALVPTQLHRVLDDPAAASAAAGLSAVLLGGAAAPAALLARARAAGVRVVTSYGGTETAGGCLYDGAPLDGVGVHLDGGRLEVSGAVLAARYRGRPDLTAEAFVLRGGTRRFLTPDLGRLHPRDGSSAVAVLGRADDVLVTGGENVAPLVVEEVLAGLDGVAEVLVVGVPDERWGQRVVALVVAAPGAAPGLDAARSLVRGALGAAAAPRELLLVDALPRRGIGKPDRRAAADLAGRLVRGDG